MSEELRQKGYLKRGKARGEPVGPYEGFNLGATTLEQLRQCNIIPDRSYGRFSKRKPDGIVVDRRGDTPLVKFVAEFKDKIRAQVAKKAKALINDPHPSGCKKLAGMKDGNEPVWRVRSGDYRILYVVREVEVIVLDIGNRKDIYK